MKGIKKERQPVDPKRAAAKKRKQRKAQKQKAKRDVAASTADARNGAPLAPLAVDQFFTVNTPSLSSLFATASKASVAPAVFTFGFDPDNAESSTATPGSGTDSAFRSSSGWQSAPSTSTSGSRNAFSKLSSSGAVTDDGWGGGVASGPAAAVPPTAKVSPFMRTSAHDVEVRHLFARLDAIVMTRLTMGAVVLLLLLLLLCCCWLVCVCVCVFGVRVVLGLVEAEACASDSGL